MTDNDRQALRVPQLGNGIEELTILEWLIEVGETFAEGDPIATVETDKATMEMPAPIGGRLVEVVVGDGDEAAVGAVLGWVEAAG